MKNLFYASHMRLVYFQRFFAFFSFLFLDSWIEILDILLNNASLALCFFSRVVSFGKQQNASTFERRRRRTNER